MNKIVDILEISVKKKNWGLWGKYLLFVKQFIPCYWK